MTYTRENFIIPLENLFNDTKEILNLANSFEDIFWKKLITFGTNPEEYWLEVRGERVGSLPLIQSFLSPLGEFDPGHVAFHKLPPRMKMPIHVDIAMDDSPPRKSILIIPLTKPCPGTRFYDKKKVIFEEEFQGPVIARVDHLHDIYNDQDFNRLTLQVSFQEPFECMVEKIKTWV